MNCLPDIRLSKNEEKIINENDKLLDTHMLQFMKLINHELGFEVMQNPIFIELLQFVKPVPKGRRHIQILFSGSSEHGHWICTYYDSKKLYVYDSTNSNFLHSDCLLYLRRLFPFHPEIVPIEVRSAQSNSVDCGVYAIAFATSLRFDILPHNVCFRKSEMRNHLSRMFEEKIMRQFPIEQPIGGPGCSHGNSSVTVEPVLNKNIFKSVSKDDEIQQTSNRNVIAPFDTEWHVVTNRKTRNATKVVQTKSNEHFNELTRDVKRRMSKTSFVDCQGQSCLDIDNEVGQPLALSSSNIKISAEVYLKPSGQRKRKNNTLSDTRKSSNDLSTNPIFQSNEISTRKTREPSRVYPHLHPSKKLLDKKDQNQSYEIPRESIHNKTNSLTQSHPHDSPIIPTDPILNEEEECVIRNNDQLTPSHLYKFMLLFNLQLQSIKMQNLFYDSSEKIEPIPVNQSHIQILFGGCKETAHSICLHYDCNNAHSICIHYDCHKLYVYNNTNDSKLHPDHETYLARLFPFKPEIVFITMQSRENNVDCEVYAIAFATSLYFGISPNVVSFDEMRMRNHLLLMFRDLKISKFPLGSKCLYDEGEARKENRKRKNIEQQKDRNAKRMKLNRKTDMKLLTKDINSNNKNGFFEHNEIVENRVSENYLGPMNVKCKLCGSLNFISEKPSDGKFNNCCHKGKIKISNNSVYPESLKELMTGRGDPISLNFKRNIRSYNNALAFASFGAHLEKIPGKGPFVYRIHGQIYHNVYTLHPNEEDNRKYGQLYILDTEDALQNRISNPCNKNCLKPLLLELDQLLRNINPFAEAYRMMREVELEEKIRARKLGKKSNLIEMWIKRDRTLDKNKFNLPTCNEVAVVFVGENGAPPIDRDLCIHPRGDKSIPISTLSPNLDPMTYPLLFPYGETGWTINLKQVRSCRNVTALQFYSYRLAYRGIFNPCLFAFHLTQQYIVDMWAKVEGERLKYIRLQQGKIRAELYSGLMDFLYNKAQESNLRAGKMIILPSSFTGGPRAYQQSFMDGMGLVQKFGKPDMFITMTCNPKWREIQENLMYGQTPSDRPDLIARVFKRKVESIKSELLDNQIFGEVVAYIYVIEFQKRGLPHMHMLLFLHKDNAIRSTETIDKLICAEIPDKNFNLRLYDIVKKTMIHGPCGKQNFKSPCMNIDSNTCSKGFPKAYSTDTLYREDGYPIYRRRKDDRKIEFGNKVADNSYVVPYNPYLLLKFNCHINVEICSTIKCIKYLFKYCYKGHDCAMLEIKNTDKVLDYDEVSSYLNTRYVCPPEAMHRLLQFKMQEQSHATYRLAVHLENQQQICFKEGLEIEALEKFKDTTLTAWFKLNVEDCTAKQYLYTEISDYYRFDDCCKMWKKRKTIHKPILSRMYFVSPKDIERYCLRTLLLHVRGAESFENLRTYNGVIYKTFVEAARARKIVKVDDEWDKCLEEAVTFKFPRELCYLFGYICVFGCPINALDLWIKYKDMFYGPDVSAEIGEQIALSNIQEVLKSHGLKLEAFNLPLLKTTFHEKMMKRVSIITKECMQDLITSLNSRQKEVYDIILKSVRDDDFNTRYIYLDGPGGSGKSYLHNVIIHSVEYEGYDVIPIAWTGIAANLLKGGRTVHSTFRLPLPVTETSTCNISCGSNLAKQLIAAKLIIWDEITMAPKYALQTIDSFLRDVMKIDKPFGGKTVLLSGDFRQTLPIVRHGNRSVVIETCVKSSYLWQYFKVMHLKVNERLKKNEIEFSQWLLSIGDAKSQVKINDDHNFINIPKQLISSGNLVEEIFGKKIYKTNKEVQWFVILAPTNSQVLNINNSILAKLEGIEKQYISIDTNLSDDHAVENVIPTEFLNSLTPDGLPSHKLLLKEGAIIMLLRNLNIRRGLCNGTRLIVVKLMQNIICGEILNGLCQGEQILIPRIDLSPAPGTLPFKMERRQFPVRLAYAMTINKSQGQSFEKVGINLSTEVFSHGQLYVALSRVRSEKNLKIYLGDNTPSESTQNYTRNIVYTEIL